MPEEEKKIDDILKKLGANVNTPIIFQSKPKYVEIIEKEIEQPVLKADEYIKVPFNPFNPAEVFSMLVVYYFLGKDGLTKKYPELDIDELSVGRPLVDEYVKIISVYPFYKSGKGLVLHAIYLKKPYVLILRDDDIRELIEILDTILDSLSSSIENEFNAEILESMSNSAGIFLFLKTHKFKKITIEEFVNEEITELSDVPWTERRIKIDLSRIKNLPKTNQIYQMSIYYRQKDHYLWIFIPNYIMQDLYEFVFLNYYKEKK